MLQSDALWFNQELVSISCLLVNVNIDEVKLQEYGAQLKTKNKLHLKNTSDTSQAHRKRRKNSSILLFCHLTVFAKGYKMIPSPSSSGTRGELWQGATMETRLHKV